MFREFVKDLRSNQVKVKIFTANGFGVEGVIENHGPEAILVVSGKKRILIMKHAIATIQPV